ncbi:SMI1/KNR4 family protein [Verrucomicrobium sp. BvORR034]|uniref:SMI1/KNR4 family protein n=1 Tax=Verrucomicrobium sp. BvORR034 TaxID=1396418 RepID=UPI000678D6AA|nr:SMI1/KNR4 family protein [Verrucomicrobium sp. BvORR034]
MSNSVLELEKRLGIRLPEDYRSFLAVHTDSFLDHARLFLPPRSGVVDSLLTADDILQNDDQKRIGIPEKSLMHIGENLLGGYLYTDVSDGKLGQIHYMEGYVFREQFSSFSAFLDETQPEAA